MTLLCDRAHPTPALSGRPAICKLTERESAPPTTLLEADFPYDAVSRLVAADRRVRDTAYQAHAWWARRPSALVRSALVAAALPGDATAEAFRDAYASEDGLLTGWKVNDIFAGGGTTLVEAARLGATAVGTDVDPLAVMLVSHQLDPAPSAAIAAAGEALAEHLSTELAALWPTQDDAGTAWQPLHYFSIPIVTCPECSAVGPLYRSLVLARSIGKPGSVIRDQRVVGFCPDCRTPQSLPAGAKTLGCCGRRRPLTAGTYRDGLYHCASCRARADHEALRTGAAPRAVIAVEEIHPTHRAARRRIRPATDRDLAGEVAAQQWLSSRTPAVECLSRAIDPGPRDRRPVSFGIRTIRDLHTARQAAYLVAAQAWLDGAALDARTERAMRLAVSSTVVSNNRLCGYATDYGRLAPLFSVRAFSLPTLAVELHPLNPRGGRGTLAAAVTRVAKSAQNTVRRHVLDDRGRPTPTTMTLARVRPGHAVTAGDSSTSQQRGGALADICLTDPPYFDFIPYDTLSQVYRAWLPEQALAGRPLLPSGDDPVTEFGTRLGAALRNAADGLKPGALIAFTYKGDRQAWAAVGTALDTAKLLVTGLWPVLADPHMGHHSSAGNCEYDLLLVARSANSCRSAESRADVDAWLRRLPTAVSAADVSNMREAEAVAYPRWGLPVG